MSLESMAASATKTLIGMGYTGSYIRRAIKVYNAGKKDETFTQYDIFTLIDYIQKLQAKDKKNGRTSSARKKKTKAKNNKISKPQPQSQPPPVPQVRKQSPPVQRNTNTNTNNNNNNNNYPPYIPHLSMEEASKLAINDYIDHRDMVGRYTAAIIKNKNNSILSIHYPQWGSHYDIQCNYQTELHRFAKYKSISQRARHNLHNLKKGNLIDINPLSHKGWKTGEIIECDNKSGQIKVKYEIKNGNQTQSVPFHWWTHVDNKHEIAGFGTRNRARYNDGSIFPLSLNQPKNSRKRKLPNDDISTQPPIKKQKISPSNHRKPWSNQHIKQLKDMHSNGKDVNAIANALGRTSAAVESKIRSVSVSISLSDITSNSNNTPPSNQIKNQINNNGVNGDHQMDVGASNPVQPIQSLPAMDIFNKAFNILNNKNCNTDVNVNDVSMVDNNMDNDIDGSGDNDNDNNNPIARVFAMCDAARAEHGEHESKKIMIKHLLQQDELDSDQHQSLNYHQKEELQRGIQCLDPVHFDPLIEMLKSFIPDGQNDDDETDEWELDIDVIDDPLQVKMYNYMLKAIKQQENERIQREGATIATIQKQNVNVQLQPASQPINKIQKALTNIINNNSNQIVNNQSQSQLQSQTQQQAQAIVIINNNNNNNLKKEEIFVNKSVNEWNHFEIIRWFNRVSSGELNRIEFKELRDGIKKGKLCGCDMSSINDVMLRILNINKLSDRKLILNNIMDLVNNQINVNDINDIFIKYDIDCIPESYFDPIQLELMNDPVLVTVSGYSYEREFIQKYIQKYKKDPITKQTANLTHIVTNRALKQSITEMEMKQKQ